MKVKKAADHVCPDRCHVCPLMKNGDIMPFCMGGAVYGDLIRCTCTGERLDRKDRIQKLEHRVMVLEKCLGELRCMKGANGDKSCG